MSTFEAAASPGKHTVTVFIDGHEYHSESVHVTEEDLRHLARPPIPDDHEVWLDVPDAPDQPLRADEHIELVPGMRFFTEPGTIEIFIDRSPYLVTNKRMTGSQLRAIPQPPVAEDRDLWLDVPDAHDRKIRDEEVIRLRQGMRFYTAPGRINPGAHPAGA